MLKKYLSISLVLLAYGIMLLHNCLPHDHIEAIDHCAHHGKDHHDDDDDDHGFLNHALAHFQHDRGAESSAIAFEKLDIDQKLSTARAFIPLITVFLLKIGFEPPPAYLPPRHSLSLYSYLSSTTNSRRGPPAFIA